MTLFFMCDKILGEKYWDIAKSVRHKTLTIAFRWFESSYPSQKSPRTKFGEIFTYYLFTFHFSLIPSGRFLAK